jgi:hypothetical protein
MMNEYSFIINSTVSGNFKAIVKKGDGKKRCKQC